MEVGSASVKAIVGDEVERREKIVRRVSRGEECEDARIYVRGCRRDVWYGRRLDSAPSRRKCKRRGDVVGIRVLSPVSTCKYGLELEVDGGSGGC